MIKVKYIIVLCVLLCVPAIEDSIAITNVIGLNSECVDCPTSPLILSLVCDGSLGITCPATISVNPLDTSIMYGTDAVGSNSCIKSINSGVTWSFCSSQPPGSGNLQSVGVTATGAVLATRHSGNLCNISRSTNGTTSWINVFQATGNGPGCVTSVGLGSTTNIKCGSSNCIVGGQQLSGVGLQILSSSDDGASWSALFNNPSVPGSIATTMFDGTFGAWGSTTIGGVAQVSAYTTSGLPGFASTTITGPFNTCYGTFKGISSSVLQLCNPGITDTGTLVNLSSNISASISLIGINTATRINGVNANGQLYVIGGKVSGDCPNPCTGIYFSRDGVVFPLLNNIQNTSFSFGDAIFVNGKIYITLGLSGLNARLFVLS